VQYRITVTQLVYGVEFNEGQIDSPAGDNGIGSQRAYYRDDDSEKDALKWFNVVANIKNPEAFKITVEEQDIWKEDPEWTRNDWHREVRDDNTLLGYWDWVEHQKEGDE